VTSPRSGRPHTIRDRSVLDWNDGQGERADMSLVIELIPDEEEGGFTARIPDIPAYGEGGTEEATVADLREAVRGYIETFGLDDALLRVSQPSMRKIDWDLAELARD
jgi:predicted RNase H-like HicB family nuclease